MLQRRRSTDPDEFASIIPGGRFGVLPLGPFAGEVSRADPAPGVSLREVRLDQPCVLRGEFHGAAIAFVVPSLDGAPCLFDGEGQRGGFSLHLRRPGDAPTLRALGAGHRAGTVTLAEDVLTAAVAALEGPGAVAALPRAGAGGRLRSGAARAALARLVHLHGAAMRAMAARGGAAVPPPATLRFWADGALAALVEALAEGGGLAAEHGARRRQANAFARIVRCVEEGGDEGPVGLLDVCAATGIPRRTAEATLRAHTGLAATEWLRLRRLARAREALLRPREADTVTSVALRFGFPELGRFAGRYARAYGEPPSATLARARGVSSPPAKPARSA